MKRVRNVKERRVRETTMELENIKDREDHDMAKPQEPVETLHEKDSHKRNPTWARELIQEAERYGAPERMHRERKRPNPYNNYVALLFDIINKEPSTYEEAAENNE